MKHFECAPTIWHAKHWSFDWDADTGEISGRDAQAIKDTAAQGEVAAHPQPWSWVLTDSPLMSKTDMAAIIGFQHELPEDLIDFYPVCNDDIPEGALI